MSELDLTQFLHTGSSTDADPRLEGLFDDGLPRTASVPNLDWLEVDEKEYRASEVLPKQNLDIVPELDALWSHEDRPAKIVPNDARPRMMLQVAEASSGPARYAMVVRTARLALLQSDDPGALKQALTSRFDADSIKGARDGLVAAYEERGLLGRYYVAASDFPSCLTNNGRDAEFVRRFAARAPYLLAKEACGGCVHAADGRCGVFQKKIVLDVPYGEGDADRVERVMAASGRRVTASAEASPRERIRKALAAPTSIDPVASTPKPIEHTARALRKVDPPKKVHLPVLATARAELVARETTFVPQSSEGKTASTADKVAFDKVAFEVSALLRREMLRGRGERELVASMKLSFSADDLNKTRASWGPLFREAGFLGSVYTTQESFDACQEGADFFAKHNPSIKAVVASEKCDGCAFNRMARCAVYGRPLVASAEALLTPTTVAEMARTYRRAGRLPAVLALPEDPAQALKTLYRAASPAVATRPVRASVERELHASAPKHVTAGLTKRDIVRTARRYLNEGLYGKDLGEALRRQFDPRDIVASQDDLRPFVAEQGLVGFHYVDPTVYDDYGKGCHEASRLHRSRLVPYVKAASSCETCVHQARKGHCSQMNKTLVLEPPYLDKVAQQRSVLASGKSTEVPLEQLMQGRSMVAEYGLQPMTIELDIPAAPGPEVKVALGRGHGAIKL
jgi:hypothetical protein